MRRYITKVAVRQLTIGVDGGILVSLQDCTVTVRHSTESPTGAVIELGDGTEIPCMVPAGADLSDEVWEVSHLGVICDSGDNALGLIATPPEQADDTSIYDEDGQGDLREILIMTRAEGTKEIGWRDDDSNGYFFEFLPTGHVTSDFDVRSCDRNALLVVDEDVELLLSADGFRCGRYEDGAVAKLEGATATLSVCRFVELTVGADSVSAEASTVKLMSGGEGGSPFLALADESRVGVVMPAGLTIPDEGIECTGVLVLRDDEGDVVGLVPVSHSVPELTIALGDDEVTDGDIVGLALIVKPEGDSKQAAWYDDESGGPFFVFDTEGDCERDEDGSTNNATLVLVENDVALNLTHDGNDVGSTHWCNGVLRVRLDESEEEAPADDTAEESVGEV